MEKAWRDTLKKYVEYKLVDKPREIMTYRMMKKLNVNRRDNEKIP